MFRTIASIIALAFLQLQPSWADEPASPIERVAPDYPDECEPKNGNSDRAQFVDVIYDITSEGLTENVRVLESTDRCFETAALEAVRKWRFEPRMVDGRPTRQLDYISRITFTLDDGLSPEVEEMLARMASKIYPEKCMRDANDVEYVKLQYDISKDGVPKDVEIVESTNSCFNKSAIGAIEGWRYDPKIVDGVAVERTDVEVTLTFRTED